VSIGTSLDGPEPINDAQRGAGYFKKTMAGIDRARSWGLDVGCITTFTRSSAPFWRDVVNFFISERLSFSVHASLPALRNPNSHTPFAPKKRPTVPEPARLLHPKPQEDLHFHLRSDGKSIPHGKGHICTFKDCLGMFLVIDPAGDIFPCQRFCGVRNTGWETWMMSLPWKSSSQADCFAHEEREEHITEACRECAHYPTARGLPLQRVGEWQWFAKRSFLHSLCEDICAIQDRLLTEMGSEENIAAMPISPPATVQTAPEKGAAHRYRPYGRHPSQVARNAKRIVAAVEMARGPDIPSVAGRLVALGICRNEETALASLAHLRESVMPIKPV